MPAELLSMVSWRLGEMQGWGAVLGGLTLAGALLASGSAIAEPDHGEFAYELQGLDGVMVFFDMEKKISLFGRRDAKSIGMGDIGLIEPCHLGRFCLRLLQEDIPIVVLGEGETLDVPGLRVKTDKVSIGDAPRCNRTRLWADNGDFSENVHCGALGIVSFKFRTRTGGNQDYFLKSMHGLGAVGLD